MNHHPTPETDAAVQRCGFASDQYVYANDMRDLERRLAECRKALDTLTLVVGLTPIKGNLAALQDAFNLARETLTKTAPKP